MIESPNVLENQRSNASPDSNAVVLGRLLIAWVGAHSFGILWAMLASPLVAADGKAVGAGPIFVQNLGLWIGLGIAAVWLVDGPFARLRTTSRAEIASSLRLSGRPIDLALGVVAGWGLHWAIVAVYWVIDQFADKVDIGETAEELVQNSESVTGRILLILLVVVGAPLFEELFYRSAVLKVLTPNFGVVASVIAGGIFFGIAHFQADQIPGLTLVGIVLGVLHVKTKRSLANMAAHATFNLLTVLSLWKLGIPGIA